MKLSMQLEFIFYTNRLIWKFLRPQRQIYEEPRFIVSSKLQSAIDIVVQSKIYLE